MVDIVNTVVEGEASLQVEPELPIPVDDDLTSAQDSVIDIVEDNSTTTEDKVIQITEELSVQVPDISEDDMVDIVNTVVEGEASLQVEPELPIPVDDDLTSAQDSVIDIVEDDSTTTEDKGIQIIDKINEKVPDIPRLPPVLIDKIALPVQPNPVPEIPRLPPVLIDEITRPVQPNPVPEIPRLPPVLIDEITRPVQPNPVPEIPRLPPSPPASPGTPPPPNNDLQQFHSMLANRFVSSLF
jgi:hypothetical protein